MAEPTREKLLSDIDAPKWTISITANAEPMRAILRSDIEDPRWT
jgi:hypothetical protein